MMDERATTAAPDGPDVIGWTVDRRGVVQVQTAVAPDAPPLAYAFEDPDGNQHAVEPKARARSPHGDVNLIAVGEADADWTIVAQPSATRLGTNLSDAWTLVGVKTYYLGSIARDETLDFTAEALLVDPLTQGATPVRPLTRYVFRLLAAAHRCPAAVDIRVQDAHGGGLDTHVATVDPSYRGGGEAETYFRLKLDFVTPPGAAQIRIALRKGRTEKREDSFVFFTRPELTASTDVVADPALMSLSPEALRRVRDQDASEIEGAVVAPPAELFRGAHAMADLLVGDGRGIRRIGPLALERTPEVAIDSVRLDRARLRFSGRLLDGRTEATLGVFVDGALSGTVETVAGDQAFDGLSTFAAEHLDGRPHVIELRQLPQHAPLATLVEILPLRMTPWESVQALSRSPEDITASPTAAHHFRAYRAWLAAKAADPALVVPDLPALHDALLQGFRVRPAYPPLRFPEHAAPDVSIVIPAHDRFEVTYHALCALLFAYNRASFEVILVDDASTDATARAEDLLEGVRIVRHALATGFVDACNDGAATARGRYVCFLNNDTEATAGWLDELVRAFEAFEGVGLAGAKLVYADGRLQEAGGLVWRSGNPENVGRGGNAADPRHNYLRQVDYVSGAAILLPAEVWRRVGGFSPEFAPGYFEDTDLAMKVREAGLRVVYVPSATVIHFEGQSAGTSVAAGMKRFQEVNRPKFKRKWGARLLSHGVEGERPDREKDRGVAFRVLFIDQRCPQVDTDAGSYAAFQEIRLLQALGAKVTLLPRNLAWMDRHTTALQRIGVECLHAPYVLDFNAYLRERSADYDVVYVNRYKIAEQIVAAVREAAPKAKIVLNLADLHFLRELREAEAGSPGYTADSARKTRTAELAVIREVDLTLSYTDIEMAVLQSHLDDSARTARLPWVVDVQAGSRPAFSDTRDLLFLGGFGHPPNIKAVEFFVAEVMPQLRTRLPGVALDIVGSNPPPAVTGLAGDDVRVRGLVQDLQPVFDRARLFVAPLLAGAGIKGKVLEAMARGSAMVLSPVAVEGTGLVDGVDCLIADTPQAWVEAVTRLYGDEALWTALGKAAQAAARTRYGFDAGVRAMSDVLMKVDIYGAPGLHYLWTRPDQGGGAS